MKRDIERIERIQRALQDAELDAVVCALPTNVLLLSGYWPVVGSSLAIATRNGRIVLLVPEDEQELTESGCADEVHTFPGGSLSNLKSIIEMAAPKLAKVLRDMGLEGGCALGYESGPIFEPSSYASMHLYGEAIHDLLDQAAPSVTISPARELLVRLRAILTANEVDRVRLACRIAEDAFNEGARKLRAGMRETEAAAQFRAPLSIMSADYQRVTRADGFAYCMSGLNSARAYAAYQRSRDRELARGDLVLVHCNSNADGYWTDITRTFHLGQVEERKREMYDAVFAARRAAIETIRAGVAAAEVDRAAREVLKQRGFGDRFKHGLGHGVGFAAINHNALPRLHPASIDVLEVGMVFNIEPAIYIDGYGGLRHCDMVAVTETGPDLLTPFQSNFEQLAIG